MAKTGSRARQRAASRRAKQKRQRQLAVLAIVGGVVVIVVGALILTSQTSAVQAVDVGDYSGYPQGVQDDGAPYIGELDAPAVITEYSDFGCAHCANLAETVHRLIETYVADGSLKIVYKPVSFVTSGSPIAAEAALCAADQDMFWEMHDALFGVLNTQGSAAFTTGAMKDLAGQIGLEEGTFNDCMDGGDKRAIVQDVLVEADRLGVHGTPSVMYNGQFLDASIVPLTYEGLESLILDTIS